MKVILVRHGETEENSAGIFQGHIHGKLTEQGIDQARKAALRLKNEKIDAIFSSDLARAADTAKEIRHYHRDVPLILTESLREFSMGILTGKKKSEIGPIDWKNKRPEGVESEEQAKKRLRGFIDETYKKYPKSTVVFVSHGGAGRQMLALVQGKRLEEMPELGNASISIFEITEDKKHRIHMINNTGHLR
ncbi:TPA: histidine phosphatase family protein [Candidatus Woesearchaeota archaeon]|nr:histidine phosphatase family protein [Candidatus Woesearchaeota archaeon]